VSCGELERAVEQPDILMINASRFAELKIFRETVWTVAKITRADRSVDPEFPEEFQ
jgi:hypothetical protein